MNFKTLGIGAAIAGGAVAVFFLLVLITAWL